ncbi:hypothetical protein RRG08_056489 [Elysia crispata]|uniref:Uncharacterized protein n=1 Tax=Elysia crispata TaxID=231223 RepID=A0AAE0XRW4_9GAST|nr:hypothetical protein RRG08_056489 [Elysia crispata]
MGAEHESEIFSMELAAKASRRSPGSSLVTSHSGTMGNTEPEFNIYASLYKSKIYSLPFPFFATPTIGEKHWGEDHILLRDISSPAVPPPSFGSVNYVLICPVETGSTLRMISHPTTKSPIGEERRVAKASQTIPYVKDDPRNEKVEPTSVPHRRFRAATLCLGLELAGRTPRGRPTVDTPRVTGPGPGPSPPVQLAVPGLEVLISGLTRRAGPGGVPSHVRNGCWRSAASAELSIPLALHLRVHRLLESPGNCSHGQVVKLDLCQMRLLASMSRSWRQVGFHGDSSEISLCEDLLGRPVEVTFPDASYNELVTFWGQRRILQGKPSHI